MRKLVAGFAASLDGYIEGPNGEYDWILIDPEINFAEQMKRYDAFFMGRRSYEAMRKMGGGASRGITNYVFSTTLDKVDKNYTLIRGDIAVQVQEMKEAEGKDIAVWGGASLLASLLDLRLVDEISIAIIPVLLGQGKPMVAALTEKVGLTLQSTKTYSNGTVQLTYNMRYNNADHL